MKNRMLTWGVLLFNFGSLFFLIKEPVNEWSISFNRQYHVPIITLPQEVNVILGGITLGLSAVFIIFSLFSQEWAKDVEDYITDHVYYLWFVIYWSLYSISFSNTMGKIIQSATMEDAEFISIYGFIIFFVIPYISFREFIRLKRKNPDIKSKTNVNF